MGGMTHVSKLTASSSVELIARQFSQAADKYQCHDVVQRVTAQALLAEMTPCGCLLDIGCGPGTELNGPLVKQVVALDIAPGMLLRMQAQYPDYLPLCADAKALPLIDNSIDTVYSNLALQWCTDLPAAIQELARILRIGGECHLAIVVDGSLSQLKQLGLRVNHFKRADEILDCFSPALWQLDYQQLESITVHFEQLNSLLYSIKGVGASVRGKPDDKQRPAQLRGRQDWLAMKETAEQLRGSAGLPLTYKILIIRAKLKG